MKPEDQINRIREFANQAVDAIAKRTGELFLEAIQPVVHRSELVAQGMVVLANASRGARRDKNARAFAEILLKAKLGEANAPLPGYQEIIAADAYALANALERHAHLAEVQGEVVNAKHSERARTILKREPHISLDALAAALARAPEDEAKQS